ncbi:MAG: hypothetical protein LBB75_01225 [Oscillospiraceae bacterium]|jgi:hypothetical protein|nr:hypothetical protein [Oscillospiraceae bacterium]
MKYSLLEINKNIDGFAMGKGPRGCFAITLNPNAEDFAYCVADFIRYEQAHGRTVRFKPRSFDPSDALNSVPESGSVLRPYDPQFVTHSTTLEAYEKITRDGQLKSTSQLREEGSAQRAIGFLPLGEPQDYLDYVMFGKVGGGPGGEVVVNSHLRGKPCFDPNTPYEPQARMYFDAKKVIEDGLAVRDGTHIFKVYGALPLEGYLLRTVRAGDVELPPGKVHWTPALFAEAADALFYREMGVPA